MRVPSLVRNSHVAAWLCVATLLGNWPIVDRSIAQEPAAPFCQLKVTVRDADTHQLLPARLYLRSNQGESYYFESESPSIPAVKYQKQNWINKDSIEYHTTIGAARAHTKIPAKSHFTLIVEKGKEYLPVQREIESVQGEFDCIVELKRWCAPNAAGWYSGDTHLHRTVQELKNVLLAEDLNVALPLTSWVTFSDRPPANGDKNLEDSQLSELVAVDSTHVIWPRNTEYEIFTVGKKQHTLGALFVLGHRQRLEQTVPPWSNVIEAMTKTEPQVLFDMDKLDWPFAMLLPSLAPNALYELANNHVWRTQFAFRQWNSFAPAFMQPPYGTQEGGHRQWLDYTHQMYYILLNCGLRLPPTAGTANGVHPVPAGFGRVYVYLPNGFQFDAWMEGLRSGRSFVTTGPILFATANEKHPGEVFKRSGEDKQPIRLKMQVQSQQPLLYGEVIVNGQPLQLLRANNSPMKDGGYSSLVDFELLPERSGWFAIRFWESQPDGQVRFAHTAPWYVEIGNQPVQLERYEKAYLVERMQREIERSSGIVSGEAMEEYRRGLAYYQALPVKDDSTVVQRHARPLGDAKERWLNSMIVDHRFSSDEIRMATGLSIDDAEREIALRSNNKPVEGVVRVLPYPGGRHPRKGFLDGALMPQRDTKISIFPPWKQGGYVVVDVPEAIFSNLGLIYLAHTHVPTIWDQQSISLVPTEWFEQDGKWTMTRTLPNRIKFESQVIPVPDGVDMSIHLTNGTSQLLSGLRVQICTMLKATEGFNQQQPLRSEITGPKVTVGDESGKRWIETQWTPSHRVWTNPPVPCIHSDPIFPDCPPGETVTISGTLRFKQIP